MIEIVTKMPWWYFEKEELKNTPSFRDGVDFDTEKRYRRCVEDFVQAYVSNFIVRVVYFQ